MLRSGRSALPAKRGGLWAGYGRPRWGSGHMLRSGRSDPDMRINEENDQPPQSMQEVEELANNENYETRNIE